MNNKYLYGTGVKRIKREMTFVRHFTSIIRLVSELDTIFKEKKCVGKEKAKSF